MDKRKDIERGNLVQGSFGVPKDVPTKAEKPVEQTYTGEGIAPKMKDQMLAKANEIEEYIKSQRIVSREVIEGAKAEWEGMNEYALMKAANESDAIMWMRSPGTYLALAEILKKKASE